MDITQLFKAGVMTVKLRLKNDPNFPAVPDKKRILPKTNKNSKQTKQNLDYQHEFAKQARDVCSKITNLKNVLLENRSAYMRIAQHLKRSTTMSDSQRDLIDRESEKFVSYYTQHIAKMRSEWKSVKRKPQEAAHMDCIIDLLSNYLREVQQIYMDQKKYRTQHELDTYRMLKLATDSKKVPVRHGGSIDCKAKRSNSFAEDDLQGDWNDNGDESLTGSSLENNNDMFSDSLDTSDSSVNILSKSQQAVIDDDIQKNQQLVDEEATVANKLSPEDVQMYEQENEQLYNELQGLSEEVDQIERNVVDIAHLQDIFTEKVSAQQYNIERISNAVIGATENVKDANEQIKRAIQRNAGLRVWSLFFLLVMSFALLFLDWYYD